VAFYNQRGTAGQCIKEGKSAIKWTRLSCRSFAANAVRLQLYALAYNLGNFLRTLAMPKTAEPWSLTSLREKLIKIGAAGTGMTGRWGQMRQTATAEMRLDEGKATSSSTARRATRRFGFEQRQLRLNFVAARLDETENHTQEPGNLGKSIQTKERCLRDGLHMTEL
jgi:hypothetical protein